MCEQLEWDLLQSNYVVYHSSVGSSSALKLVSDNTSHELVLRIKLECTSSFSLNLVWADFFSLNVVTSGLCLFRKPDLESRDEPVPEIVFVTVLAIFGLLHQGGIHVHEVRRYGGKGASTL